MRRIIRADGSELPLDRVPTVRELESMIGAATLDTVSLRHLDGPLQVMLLDDAGHSKGLPINLAATKLYWARCGRQVDHVIRGDVVIVFDDDYAPKGTP